MKNLLIITFLICISLPLFSQSKLVSIENDKIFGKNFKTNSDIIGTNYLFSERIENSYIDTISNLLTLQLRGITKNGKYLQNSGNIALFDLTNKTEKWSKKINYQLSSIFQLSNVIIQKTGIKSYCLDIENGSEKWEVKNSINYVNSHHKIGTGYKVNTFANNTNKLEGIDLTNGKPIWEREINREYGWNKIYNLNDSIVLVVSSGLHSINLKNGSGWDYNTITGKNDYTSTIVANTVGVALGVLTGTYVIPYGQHDVVRDIVSNILIKNGNIYFASKENIVRLDQNGQVNWSFNLPKDKTSKSSIFIIDNVIYMVNKGYAFFGNRQIDFGAPFITAFDKETGIQKFFSQTNDNKKQIIGYKVYNNEIILLYNDKIAKYSMADGSLVLEKNIDITSFGELQFIISDQTFIKSETKYIPLISTDSSKIYVYTKNGKTLEIDGKLELTNQIENDQLYFNYLKTNKLKFLAKGNETVVIDDINLKIADLSVSKYTILIGSKLYNIKDNNIEEINIKELLNEY